MKTKLKWQRLHCNLKNCYGHTSCIRTVIYYYGNINDESIVGLYCSNIDGYNCDSVIVYANNAYHIIFDGQYTTDNIRIYGNNAYKISAYCGGLSEEYYKRTPGGYGAMDFILMVHMHKI